MTAAISSAAAFVASDLGGGGGVSAAFQESPFFDRGTSSPPAVGTLPPAACRQQQRLHEQQREQHHHWPTLVSLAQAMHWLLMGPAAQLPSQLATLGALTRYELESRLERVPSGPREERGKASTHYIIS
jgi:hypothetical protein